MDSAMMNSDSRLLEAAASGKTDLILQLLEEEGSKLHEQKDQVRQLLTLWTVLLYLAQAFAANCIWKSLA